MLIERQCLYIEQKATFFTLLNSGKKEICFALSPVLIQEVEESTALKVFTIECYNYVFFIGLPTGTSCLRKCGEALPNGRCCS
jgi:hypothetical protein